MTRIKICGITRAEDARAAVDAGADAIGFLFWPKSARVVDPERARQIVRRLPPFVSSVGVFVDQPASHVNEVADFVGLSAVQLHGDESPGIVSTMTRPVIKALRLPLDGERLGDWPVSVPLLVDAAGSGECRGGTGQLADWTAAAAVSQVRLVILAGGLQASNVAAAIRQVHPWAVDVSSGVERAPGMKDAAMMEAFCAAVRGAEGGMA